MNIKNVFKKNQVIVYTIALMLVASGYLNYTNNIKENEVETSVQEVVDENIGEAAYEETSTQTSNEKIDDTGVQSDLVSNDEKEIKINSEKNQKVAGVGDAMLVNSSDVVEDEYFVKSKLERESMYSQMIETYEKILNSANSLESQKEKASMEMAKINETKNCIMICENLLETKGFKKSVIFVNEGSVSVIIGEKELKQEQTAQIQNIISRELGATLDNIHISLK